MGILSRFGDIVQANVNAVLDKMEDPSKMIDQYRRELNENLAEVKKETAGEILENVQIRLHACALVKIFHAAGQLIFVADPTRFIGIIRSFCDSTGRQCFALHRRFGHGIRRAAQRGGKNTQRKNQKNHNQATRFRKDEEEHGYNITYYTGKLRRRSCQRIQAGFAGLLGRLVRSVPDAVSDHRRTGTGVLRQNSCR